MQPPAALRLLMALMPPRTGTDWVRPMAAVYLARCGLGELQLMPVADSGFVLRVLCGPEPGYHRDWQDGPVTPVVQGLRLSSACCLDHRRRPAT